MFLGEYQHSLDLKGRLILPAKFRDQLSDGAFVTKGRDGCLFVYTQEEFQQVAESVRERAKEGEAQRQAARSFFAGASDVTPDRQGRIAIPSPLREFAKLDKDVTVAGVYSRIELWDSTQWRQRERSGATALVESDALEGFGL